VCGSSTDNRLSTGMNRYNNAQLIILIFIIFLLFTANGFRFSSSFLRRPDMSLKSTQFFETFRDRLWNVFVPSKAEQLNVKQRNENNLNTKILIVGAGLSGLSCAVSLLEKNETNFMIFEASNCVGGRIRTDKIDGFCLDRGFQVFIEGYPQARKLLNYNNLKLKQFRPGAVVRLDDKYFLVSDPLRRPQDIVPSLMSPIGTFLDKIKVNTQDRNLISSLSLDESDSIYSHH